MNQLCYWCGHDADDHKYRGRAPTVCWIKGCTCFIFQPEPVEFTLDATGSYPSSETLVQISNWPYQDCKGLFDYIETYWNQHGRLWRHGRYVMLATGGWSGNEDLLREIPQMVSALCWRASFIGGKHVYRLPESQGAFQSPTPAQPSEPS